MYLIKNKKTLYAPKCNQCDSDLIVVTEVSELLPDYLTPITTIIYRCSDITCQKNIDKKTSERIQLQLEQDTAKQERVKKKAEYKRISLHQI